MGGATFPFAQAQNGASGHHDIDAVSAMGPGDLPIASTGPHSLSEFSSVAMQMLYPKVETGQQGQAQHDYVNSPGGGAPTKKARKSLRKKSTNVALEVDLGPGGKATKNLKLKR